MKRNSISSVLTAGFIMMLFVGMASAELYNHVPAKRPLAYVRRFKPNVNIYPQDIAAGKGEPLYDGDTLRTDDNGYAAVQFMDKSIAKVTPNSMLTVHGEVRNDKSTSARIALKAGEIFMQVTKQAGNNDFEVSTSKSVASVKGTQFGVRSDDYAWVEEGVVEFTATVSGQTVSLRQSMYGQVNDDNSITTGQLSDEQLQKLRNDFEKFENGTEPKQMQLRFRDENGQIKEISIDYFEKE